MKVMHGKQHRGIFSCLLKVRLDESSNGPKVQWAEISMGSKVPRPRDLLNRLDSQFLITVPKYVRAKCALCDEEI